MAVFDASKLFHSSTEQDQTSDLELERVSDLEKETPSDEVEEVLLREMEEEERVLFHRLDAQEGDAIRDFFPQNHLLVSALEEAESLEEALYLLEEWRGNLGVFQLRPMADLLTCMYRKLRVEGMLECSEEFGIHDMEIRAMEMENALLMFERALARLGLYIYTPACGEGYDRSLHSATLSGLEETEDLVVESCKLPGVRVMLPAGLQVLRKATVSVRPRSWEGREEGRRSLRSAAHGELFDSWNDHSLAIGEKLWEAKQKLLSLSEASLQRLLVPKGESEENRGVNAAFYHRISEWKNALTLPEEELAQAYLDFYAISSLEDVLGLSKMKGADSEEVRKCLCEKNELLLAFLGRVSHLLPKIAPCEVFWPRPAEPFDAGVCEALTLVPDHPLVFKSLVPGVRLCFEQDQQVLVKAVAMLVDEDCWEEALEEEREREEEEALEVTDQEPELENQVMEDYLEENLPEEVLEEDTVEEEPEVFEAEEDEEAIEETEEVEETEENIEETEEVEETEENIEEAEEVEEAEENIEETEEVGETEENIEETEEVEETEEKIEETEEVEETEENIEETEEVEEAEENIEETEEMIGKLILEESFVQISDIFKNVEAEEEAPVLVKSVQEPEVIPEVEGLPEEAWESAEETEEVLEAEDEAEEGNLEEEPQEAEEEAPAMDSEEIEEPAEEMEENPEDEVGILEEEPLEAVAEVEALPEEEPQEAEEEAPSMDFAEEPHFVLDPEGESVQNGHPTTDSEVKTFVLEEIEEPAEEIEENSVAEDELEEEASEKVDEVEVEALAPMNSKEPEKIPEVEALPEEELQEAEEEVPALDVDELPEDVLVAEAPSEEAPPEKTQEEAPALEDVEKPEKTSEVTEKEEGQEDEVEAAGQEEKPEEGEPKEAVLEAALEEQAPEEVERITYASREEPAEEKAYQFMDFRPLIGWRDAEVERYLRNVAEESASKKKNKKKKK